MSEKEMFVPISRDRSLIVVSEETLHKREIKAIYYPKLEKIIKTFGSWEVNCYDLSKKWDVPKSTVYRWKEEILDSLTVDDVKVLMNDLKLTSIANIKYLQTLIRKTSDIRVKVIAMKVYADLGKNVLELLDRMGLTATETKRLTLAAAYEEYLKKNG